MEPEIFYFHGTTEDSWCKNFTIAGVFSQGTVIRHLALGIAICSENDQFCKKTGRLLATDRVLNQNDECLGRIYIILNNTRAEEYGYTLDPVNTIKTFVGESCVFNSYFREELKILFGLSNHKKS